MWEVGLPVLEAMACGTPVITSNSGLLEAALDAAILVDPDRVQENASAIDDLSQDDKLHRQLRQARLQRASQFNWSQTAQATIDILQQYL